MSRDIENKNGMRKEATRGMKASNLTLQFSFEFQQLLGEVVVSATFNIK